MFFFILKLRGPKFISAFIEFESELSCLTSEDLLELEYYIFIFHFENSGSCEVVQIDFEFFKSPMLENNLSPYYFSAQSVCPPQPGCGTVFPPLSVQEPPLVPRQWSSEQFKPPLEVAKSRNK